jgi:uncharacterized integral membrane protein
MWLKIKVWTKVTIFGLLALYAIVFLLKNMGREVEFWYWFNREPKLPVLLLVLGAFLGGVLITILLRTTFKTIRQIRDLQSRSRTEKLQREVRDMQMKAAALRTREEASTGAAAAAEPAPPSTPADPAL